MGKEITLKEYAKILDKAINDIDDTVDKIHKELDREYQKDIKALMDQAVQEFYDDYTDLHAYKRKYDLFNAYKISVHNLEVTIKTGAEFMEKRHRADNEYIYNMAFVSGWHGGAPYVNDIDDSVWGVPHPKPAKYYGDIDPDKPIQGGDLYWRTPMKPKEIKYSNWYYHRAAKASISPLARIRELLADYEKAGHIKTKQKAIQKGLKKLL